MLHNMELEGGEMSAGVMKDALVGNAGAGWQGSSHDPLDDGGEDDDGILAAEEQDYIMSLMEDYSDGGASEQG